MVGEVRGCSCNALRCVQRDYVANLLHWGSHSLVQFDPARDVPPPWSHSKGGERQLWASEVWDHDLDETLAGKDGYLARSYIDADYVRVVNLVAG